MLIPTMGQNVGSSRLSIVEAARKQAQRNFSWQDYCLGGMAKSNRTVTTPALAAEGRATEEMCLSQW